MGVVVWVLTGDGHTVAKAGGGPIMDWSLKTGEWGGQYPQSTLPSHWWL